MPTDNGYTFGTDREVLNLKLQEKIYTAKDKSNNGLFLEIRPNGRKTWAYRYTFNAKQEKLTIGRYPDLSLKDARQARDEAANQVAKGISPQQQKIKEQQGQLETILASVS